MLEGSFQLVQPRISFVNLIGSLKKGVLRHRSTKMNDILIYIYNYI